MTELDGRPTVGIQRSLYTLQSGVLWTYFFKQLGFMPVLSPATNNHISEQGIETMTAETCYPVKVSHGHVKELAGKTAYLFLPVIIDMPVPVESEGGVYCPLVQSNRYMTSMALDLDRDKIIGPIVHMKNDPKTLSVELSEQLSGKLNKTVREIKDALFYALERQNNFIDEMHKKGHEIIRSHNPDEPLVIVTGRPYNLYDERINLRLGQNLAKTGITAVPMDFINVDGVDLSDFPNMYWGLGARILRTAKYIKKNRNYFGLHLTNFSCGADSFVEHFYKYIMDDKPYLILELDEHSAVAGMMTRLEAYKNVIDNKMEKQKRDH